MRLPFTKVKRESGAASDIETVRAKLAQCQGEIQSAETQLQRTALTAVLSDDQSVFEPSAKLQALRSRKEVLQAALQEAERVEAERLAEFRSREDLARRRALAQHAGSLARNAEAVTKALAELRDAQDRLTASGGSIVALLPPHLRCPARPFDELLGAKNIAELVEVEAYRLSPAGRERPQLFGYEDNATGEIRSMAETLAALLDRVKSDFDAPPPTKSNPPPGVVSPAVLSAPVSVVAGVPPSASDDRDEAAPVSQDVTPRRGRQPPESAIIRLTSPGVGLPLPRGDDTEAAEEPIAAEPIPAPTEAFTPRAGFPQGNEAENVSNIKGGMRA
jgi:hypothetical protein